MKAVRMYAPRDLRVEEVDIPSYEADECLIKVWLLAFAVLIYQE